MFRLLYIKIRRLLGFKRKLSGGWTLEKAEDLRALYGMDIESELCNTLKEEIAKEISENGSYTWPELVAQNTKF